MNQEKSKTYFVFFASGETAGPVTPLLALAAYWKRQDVNVHPVFLDVQHSVASRLVPQHHYEFRPIWAGKFRRYWSIKNLFTPVQLLVGFVQALLLLQKYQPKLVIGAGGYAQVPVMVAAWCMRIPRLIHQQDIVVTLSNIICAPFATKITTTFEKSIRDFSQGWGFEKDFKKLNKVQCTGNPMPQTHPASRNEALAHFNLDTTWPTLLVTGGGTGAAGLNSKIIDSLPHLTEVVQIIHSTGQGKVKSIEHPRYHQYEFIDRMDLAYSAADVVIARAGIGTLTELSFYKKCSIIVPMPDSHQEVNAQLLYEKKAALILDQNEITGELLVKAIRKVLFDKELQEKMEQHIHALMPHDGAARIYTLAQELIS